MEGSESEKVFDSLNLNPKLFVNEALNIVDELVDDAFDFFHQEAANLLKTEGTNRSEDLKEGVAQIKNMVQLTLDKRLSLWEKYCLHNCFKVPQGFSLPKADGPSGDTSFDINAVENPELDEKLDFLRNKISEVGKESAELNRELQALEGQSMLSGHSAASLTEALELYQQLAVNEKFEELVRTASDFQSKVENLATRMVEDTEHRRAKKIRTSNGEVFRSNNDEGLLSATLEELQVFVDDIKTLRD
ncbi:protein MIS12 homolog [Nicotiana tabacum]|uniref:MIS12 homologue n=2 Tax=Nicotiana TaxID=4085 RepID=D0FY46_TOBAC|nr:Protein MIS12 homolog [Nicotiana tomentosiformis]NP_001312252.1 protein MIS12 homolog [Nicotiana tabacum]BAI48083.1 MIS12 homologue [Nicotiana tabacum]BAI48088.1 kinetochore protein [Nicotiana tomentosiformis]